MNINILVNKYFEMLKFVDPKGCILRANIYDGDYVEYLYRKNIPEYLTPEEYGFYELMRENAMIDITNKNEITKFFEFIEDHLKKDPKTITITLLNSNYEILFYTADHFTGINQIDQILESKLKEKILLSV